MRHFRVIVFLVISLLFSNLASCQETPKKMEWKYIDFDKIPGETLAGGYANSITKYKFNQILNYTKDIFFLLGDDSREASPDSAVSVIYSTKDFGDTWKKTSLGKGTIKEGIFAGDNLFVVLENNDRKTKTFQSSLFVSNDLGETWKKIQTFEGENIVISSLNFFSKETGVIFKEEIINDRWYNTYLITQDQGKTWEEINNIDGAKFSSNNCLFLSNTDFLFISDNQLFKYNLITKEKTLVKNLIIPKGMEAGYINKDKKTGELFTFYFNPQKESNESGIYYIEKDESISLPEGEYSLEVYSNYYYGLLYERPFSTYVWSSDRGKTWHKEKLDYLMLFTNIPAGYYGEGYIYIMATLFKRGQKEQGTYFTIGHPIAK